MPSPFPGMDPFMENPSLWPGIQHGLIAHLQRALGPLLRPAHVLCLEERRYRDRDGLELAGPAAVRSPLRPVVAVEIPLSDRVRETWLEVRPAGGGDTVTVLAIVSPINKRPGRGRRIYEAKRRLILDTATSLVEIDLLRSGEPMPLRGPQPDTDYRILVSRGERRPRAELLPFSLRDPIPRFELPLRPGESGPMVAVRAALDSVYATGSFDLRLDYRQQPLPELRADDIGWADELLRAARLR
ncbi:MAG: DUF4058 family protein [Planctomycetes bacterium]|nr:DUF4058 family protein [Planctomycetota bacterium]